MVDSLLFWRNWPAKEARMMRLLLALLLCTLSALAAAYFYGQEALSALALDGALALQKTDLDQFTLHFFQLTLSADSYLLTERFLAQPLLPSAWPYAGYGLALLLGWSLLLAAVTDLQKTAYAAGAATFAFFLAMCRLDALGVWSQLHEKAFTITCILSTLGLSYYFYAFGRQVAYVYRTLSFVALGLLLALLAAVGSPLPHPLAMALGQGMAVPMTLSVLWMLLAAPFLPMALFRLLGGRAGKLEQGNLKHYIVLCLIFLANAAYGYTQLVLKADWGLLYIPAWGLIALSGAVGLWMFRKQEPLFASVLPSEGAAIYGYLGLSFIALSTIAFAYATSMTPLTQGIDLTALSLAFAFGLAFPLYLLVNFSRPLQSGVPIAPMMFRTLPPLRFSLGYFNAWTLGVFTFGLLALAANFPQYRQAFAAYYIGMADAELLQGERMLAAEYYQMADNYQLGDPRAGYSLASLALQEGQASAALSQYYQLTRISPSVPSFLMAAELEAADHRPLDAIYVLKQGLQRFPQSGELQNNLALLYYQHGMADSALWLLEQAQQHCQQPEVAQSNYLALLAQSPVQDASVEERLAQLAAQQPDHLAYHGNALAYMNSRGLRSEQPLRTEFLPDSVLDTPQLCYAYNYALNQRGSLQQGGMTPYLSTYAQQQANIDFRPYLYFAQATQLLQEQRVGPAYQLLQENLRTGSESDPLTPYQMGWIALASGSYPTACQQLELSFKRGNPMAALPWALALLESGQHPKALEALGYAKVMGGSSGRLAAAELQPFTSQAQALQAAAQGDDKARFRALHYFPQLPEQTFLSIFQRIGSADMRAQLCLDRAYGALRTGDLPAAAQWAGRATQQQPSEALQPELLLLQHRMQALQGQIPQAKPEDYPRFQSGWQVYFQALQLRKQGQKDKAAEALQQAAQRSALQPELYAACATQLHALGKPQAAYDLLYQGYRFMPQESALLQAYTLQCARMGLDRFGDEALQELSEIMEEKAYQAFKKAYITEQQTQQGW